MFYEIIEIMNLFMKKVLKLKKTLVKTQLHRIMVVQNFFRPVVDKLVMLTIFVQYSSYPDNRNKQIVCKVKLNVSDTFKTFFREFLNLKRPSLRFCK